VEIPETCYAKTVDGVHIGYQVLGDGPRDLVWAQGSLSSIEYGWDVPVIASFLERLSSFSRLIIFDRRGAGVSDRFTGPGIPPLETGLEDITAVLDAAGSERSALFGAADGALLVALYAATYPERTDGLILLSPEPRGLPAPDFPWAWTMQEWDGFIERIEEGWGTRSLTEAYMGMLAPSQLEDPEAVGRWARYLRLTGSPASAADLQRMYRDSDIRAILPSIQAPTLIVHRGSDAFFDEAQSQYVADRIPSARFVRLPGADAVPFIDPEPIVGEVEEFLTGGRRPRDSDRVLATLVFTDIVGSTERAAALGDAAWKELLARHDEMARSQITQHRGAYIHTTGDGLLATFDGPARAVRCAQAIVEAVRSLGLELRAGCHTGEVELVGEDVQGLAVHIGARVAAIAGPSEVLVSQTVKDLVAGSGLTFEDAGEHELKGVPDRWRIYRVVE
jgi:class 3 adenylate cyclase